MLLKIILFSGRRGIMKNKVVLINAGICDAQSFRWKYAGRSKNRIHVPLKGKAVYHVAGGTKLLDEGNIYLLRNSFTKDLEMLPDYRYYHLYLDFQTTPPFLGRDMLEIPYHSDPTMLYLIRAITSMIEEYQKSMGRGYVTASVDTALFAQIARVLEVVLVHLQTNYKVAFVENEKIEQALQYIEDHYTDKLKNDDIAAALHVDTRYLSRLFTKHVDMSPYQYLTQYRIERAIGELKNGRSVAETAYMCGFQTENAFRIAFKKLMGCSPTAIVKKS